MNVIKTELPDILLFEPRVFSDERGFFFESFNHKRFEEAVGYPVTFVQDNHSKSSKGVLRGLHYQLPPHAQGKLVRCIIGEIFDVAVDIRKSSPTFGRWVGTHLSDTNKRQLWIPEGFAHGFITRTETAEVLYKTTNYYQPDFEHSICWNDQQLSIKWGNEMFPVLSRKDASANSFMMAKKFNSNFMV
ncbi:dTDP-4-dehydrorhamnose 3,5-epimerase [Aeromonas hydrophila]|uniref:dTDP-4-dehydrorhamnose 3,5-epimerase n=1 Tax=Aeromonas hydrophila TaxID=644 RepID=UPI0029D575A7|nr:dTDP-4-dehydrorhamnose 3,5-epimerase [Aeromonas hydrophila]MDX7756765.1 dTDP-4-dehydrorhamnose 3,5-epimerase [Aeromonas hydrophila]